MRADVDEQLSPHTRALDHLHLLPPTPPPATAARAVLAARRCRGQHPGSPECRFQHKARDGSEEPSFRLAFLVWDGEREGVCECVYRTYGVRQRGGWVG